MKNRPFLLFLAFLVTGTASAEESLTFSEASRRALSGNPGLKAARLLEEAAEAAAGQALACPNPALAAEIEEWGEGERSAALTQVIETGGKRRARRAEAEANRRAARILAALAETGLRAETYRRYYSAKRLQAELELLAESAALAESTASLIEHRVASGAGRRVDLLRARTNRLSLENERSRPARGPRAARAMASNEQEG